MIADPSPGGAAVGARTVGRLCTVIAAAAVGGAVAHAAEPEIGPAQAASVVTAVPESAIGEVSMVQQGPVSFLRQTWVRANQGALAVIDVAAYDSPEAAEAAAESLVEGLYGWSDLGKIDWDPPEGPKSGGMGDRVWTDPWTEGFICVKGPLLFGFRRPEVISEEFLGYRELFPKVARLTVGSIRLLDEPFVVETPAPADAEAEPAQRPECTRLHQEQSWLMLYRLSAPAGSAYTFTCDAGALSYGPTVVWPLGESLSATGTHRPVTVRGRSPHCYWAPPPGRYEARIEWVGADGAAKSETLKVDVPDRTAAAVAKRSRAQVAETAVAGEVKSLDPQRSTIVVETPNLETVSVAVTPKVEIAKGGKRGGIELLQPGDKIAVAGEEREADGMAARVILAGPAARAVPVRLAGKLATVWPTQHRISIGRGAHAIECRTWLRKLRVIRNDHDAWRSDLQAGDDVVVLARMGEGRRYEAHLIVATAPGAPPNAGAAAPGNARDGMEPVPADRGRITGAVKDAATGEPIGGASVVAYPSYGTWWAETDTEADGSFTLVDIGPGTYTVVACRDSHFLEEATGVVVNSGEATAVDPDDGLSLRGYGTLRGKVTEEGSGAELINVVVEGELASGWGRFSVRTDGHGNYTAAEVPVGSYRVTASVGGHRKREDILPAPVITTGGTTTFDFQLTREQGAIEVTVKDAATQALLSGAAVRMGGAAPVEEPAGVYTFTGVTVHKHDVVAGKDGYLPGLAKDVSVEDDLTTRITIELQAVPAQ